MRASQPSTAAVAIPWVTPVLHRANPGPAHNERCSCWPAIRSRGDASVETEPDTSLAARARTAPRSPSPATCRDAQNGRQSARSPLFHRVSRDVRMPHGDPNLTKISWGFSPVLTSRIRFPRGADLACGRFETPGTALPIWRRAMEGQDAGRGGRDGNQRLRRGLDLIENYPITVYDRELRPGGHSHAVSIDSDGVRLAVDIGFIVYQRAELCRPHRAVRPSPPSILSWRAGKPTIILRRCCPPVPRIEAGSIGHAKPG
jgi:hypothetical protein